MKKKILSLCFKMSNQCARMRSLTIVDLIQMPFHISFVFYVRPTDFALDIYHRLVNVLYVLPHIDNHPFEDHALSFSGNLERLIFPPLMWSWGVIIHYFP